MREEDPELQQPAPGTDPCGPPLIPTLVHCIHCHNEYDSYLIKWVITPDYQGKPWGHWVCPIPGCDGAGFCIDIWPVDPEWRDENGEKVFHCCDDDEYDDSADDILHEADAFIDDMSGALQADEACDHEDTNARPDDDDERTSDWCPPTSPN